MTWSEDRPPDLPGRIVAALDRIARGIRSHRQQVATASGLTPLQAELLRVVVDGTPPEAATGALAVELGVRQPTISDSLDALEHKGLIVRAPSPSDRRRSIATPTDSGRSRADDLRAADGRLRDVVASLPEAEQERVLGMLLALIEGMLDRGVIDVARTCTTCRFFRSDRDGIHCALLRIPLRPALLRVNCPEHEPRPAA